MFSGWAAGNLGSEPIFATDRAAGGDPAWFAALTAALAAASPGVGYIYRCLDEVTARFEVGQAMFVADDPELGRQVFVRGRRPPGGSWAAWHARHARPGVHTDPVLPDQAHELEVCAGLCATALRLSLARYDARHDPLTGLLNRRSFHEHLGAASARSRRHGECFSLVLLDLDRFKALNDRHGHAHGDAVLRSVGAELRRSLRGGDIACRLGGDEFALLLPGTASEQVPALIERLAERMADAASGGVGFSAGTAQCPTDGDDPEALLGVADERLYRAKIAVGTA
jgi:diguanylate cyclase (GGDEF)-like protein